MSSKPLGRITDLCSGHVCWPPVIAIQGSSNTFCNDLAVHRVGDAYLPHCCKTCHVPITSKASPSVYTNDRATAHIGSYTSCSSINIMITGSNDTWIEGF